MQSIINYLIINANLLDEIRSTITNSDSGLDQTIPGANSIFDLIATLIEFGFGVAGVIAVGFLVYGGIMYIIAGGAQEKVQAATKIITNAIIGLIIVLAALAIMNTVKDAIGAQNISQTPNNNYSGNIDNVNNVNTPNPYLFPTGDIR